MRDFVNWHGQGEREPCCCSVPEQFPTTSVKFCQGSNGCHRTLPESVSGAGLDFLKERHHTRVGGMWGVVLPAWPQPSPQVTSWHTLTVCHLLRWAQALHSGVTLFLGHAFPKKISTILGMWTASRWRGGNALPPWEVGTASSSSILGK